MSISKWCISQVHLLDSDFTLTRYAKHNKLKHYLNLLSTSTKIYSTAKETRKFVTLKLIKKENIFEFKKYILHVKLTVYYTVSFTCNIYFLNST